MNHHSNYSRFQFCLISLLLITLCSQLANVNPAYAEQLQEQQNLGTDFAAIGGCSMFPSNNIWNTPIDDLPVHARSDQWINSIGRNTGFHMDFGSGTWAGGPIGIPYNVVGGGIPKVSVIFDYDDESDPGPYPIPANPSIEWGSDHHILIVDTSTCTLYELYDASYSGGTWYAGSGAIWDLSSNALRPDTWTSADAAGLPILPGLVRYDEILSGEIDHAIRFTAANTNGYIWPARHLTSNNPSAPHIPPMGARFRLKESFDISSYPGPMQIILTAMKTYGIMLADNGSNWYVSGAPDEAWDNDMLHLLDDLTGDDFEAVDTSGLLVDYDSGVTGSSISGNAGAGGTTLSYTGGTVTAQLDGSYAFQVPNNWTGTVTPSHPCYTFTPPSQDYSNITANLTQQNFTATFNPVSGCANIDVTIGGSPKGIYGLPAGGQISPLYSGTFAGPVRVVSMNGQNIIASQRQIFGNSFSETLGVPHNQLTTQYWFSWYDGLTMKTWISVGAPSTNSTNATVDIYIGNTKMNSSSYVIPPGGQISPKFDGTFAGPVRVVNTNGQNIIASERQIYGSSFTETLGVPNNQLTTQYWFSWYDGLTMKTWISVDAPTTNSTAATVDIYIGDTKMNAFSYIISPGGQVSPKFDGTFAGPVRVVSTNGQNIIASERQIYGSSFSETLGIPNNTLTTQYWFSWYDGMTMSTWVSIGAPITNSTDATVDIYIGNTKVNNNAYVLPPGGQVSPIFPSTFAGPVRVVSTNGQDIMVSERQIFGNSFTETLGVPHNQLTTQYWFSWYDGLTMNTWVSIGKP